MLIPINITITEKAHENLKKYIKKNNMRNQHAAISKILEDLYEPN